MKINRPMSEKQKITNNVLLFDHSSAFLCVVLSGAVQLLASFYPVLNEMNIYILVYSICV